MTLLWMAYIITETSFTSQVIEILKLWQSINSLFNYSPLVFRESQFSWQLLVNTHSSWQSDRRRYTFNEKGSGNQKKAECKRCCYRQCQRSKSAFGTPSEFHSVTCLSLINNPVGEPIQQHQGPGDCVFKYSVGM